MVLKKILTLLLITSVFFGFSLTVSAHTVSVANSGKNSYKSIQLTQEILNNSNDSLSDIRIKDSNGDQVPYFIREFKSSEQTTLEQYAFEQTDSFIKEDELFFDFKLEAKLSNDIEATSIAVNPDPNAEFVKDVTVSGGYDGINWEPVTTDTIYVVDGISDCEILLSQTQKFTHYRLALSIASDPIEIPSITLMYHQQTMNTSYFLESLRPSYDISLEDDNTTKITVYGVKNLSLNNITLDTNGMFMRTLATPKHMNDDIYSLNFKDKSYTNTTVNMQGYVSTNNSMDFYIKNYDDNPIDITGITITFFTPDLVFKDNGSNHYLVEFSGDASMPAPVYDIANYKDQVLAEDIDTLDTSNLVIDFEKPIEEPEPKDYSWLLNIVVVAVAVILAIIIILNLKKINPTINS